MSSSIPPNYPPNENRGPDMLRAIWAVDGIAAVIVGIRIFTSGYILRKISLPDTLIILAFIFGITNNALITKAVHFGLGRHIQYLSPPEIMNTIKYQFISQPIGIISPTLGRVSFAIFMLRLVGPTHRAMRWILNVSICVTILINLLTCIIIFAQCRPIEKTWNSTLPGTCWGLTVQVNVSYVQGGINSLADFILTALPAIMVWNLKIKTSLKVALAGLLGLSLFAGIASIVKTVELTSLGRGGDLSWNLTSFVVWFT